MLQGCLRTDSFKETRYLLLVSYIDGVIDDFCTMRTRPKVHCSRTKIAGDSVLKAWIQQNAKPNFALKTTICLFLLKLPGFFTCSNVFKGVSAMVWIVCVWCYGAFITLSATSDIILRFGRPVLEISMIAMKVIKDTPPSTNRL